ncbi:MAG: NnrS family protein [bacterium]|nr:NnrS family protein [bacterium]
MEDPLASPNSKAEHPLWQRAFRPFFLGAGVYAGFAVLVWAAILRGILPDPGWLTAPWWHGHEMVFGFAAAAIAGFLLTASPVWTGRRATTGRPLMAVVAFWLLGRVAMLLAGGLPTWLVAAVDLAFLPAVAFVLMRTLWGSGQSHNYGVVALVVLLALANAAIHAQALGLTSASAPRALRLAVDVVVVLVIVIGGRITPAFTRNAMIRRGLQAVVRSNPRLNQLAVASVVLVAALDLFLVYGVICGIAAGLAAVAVAVRMLGWQTARNWNDPLVWSLHAGPIWVSIGLLLVAASNLGAPIAVSAGLHALTAGAIGSMILAMTTRVSLGHTGRPLQLPTGGIGIYVLVHVGALVRVSAALAPSIGPTLLLVGALLWSAAFLLFAALYGSILMQPRIDGVEG